MCVERMTVIRNDIPEVEVIGTAQTEREFWALMDGGAQPDLVLLDLGLGRLHDRGR